MVSVDVEVSVRADAGAGAIHLTSMELTAGWLNENQLGIAKAR